MKLDDAYLIPASQLFRAGVEARRMLYASGALKKHQAAVPVICIGNLTMGGTGKTPMVEYVARMLPATGRWPAIVSRGYKRNTPQSELVLVSDGQQILATAAEGGDEPILLARSLPGIAVAACADRYKACEFLAERNLCDCVLLDDGFQHLSLARDADIVLVDATKDLAKMRFFPAGTLRESPAALKRSFAVIHTKVGHPDAVARREDYYQSNRQLVSQVAPGLPQFAARFLPEKMVRLSKGKGPELELGELPGMRVAAFAGIAQPEMFFGSLRGLGADVAGKPFADHSSYTYRDIAQMLDFAVEQECEAVITTPKDAVKVMEFELPANPPMYMLTQSVELDDPAQFHSILRWAVGS